MDRKPFSPQMEPPDNRAFSMKSMLQREFSESAQEVNKSWVKKHFWTTLQSFPVHEKVESQLEGPGHSSRSRLEEPGLQRTNARGEDLRLQDTVRMDANVLQAERQPQESHWLQGSPSSCHVPQGFQEDTNVKDLQSGGPQEKKHVETPSRKAEGDQKLVGPGLLELSQKQNEYQKDPEVLGLPKEVSHEPQNIPELSDEKESEVTSKGEVDGLQTTSKQQESLECSGTLQRMEEISQPWEPCGHQGPKDLEISQALVTPDMGQTLPEKKECDTQEESSQEDPFHGLNVNNLHPRRLKRSKSLGCLEVVTPWSLLFQGSKDTETSLQLLSENLQTHPSQKTQMANVHSQPSPNRLQAILQSKTEAVQTDTEMITHISLQGKQEPEKELDSRDGGSEKTFHTQSTQTPQAQDWEGFDFFRHLQEGSPSVLHIAEMKGPSKDICRPDPKVLELARCQGPPLKKSNSPEPRELLQTRASESDVSAEILLENKHHQLQEWEKVKSHNISERGSLKLPDSVEVLQHLGIPTCKEEEVEISGPLLEMSKAPMLKKLDFQKQGAPLKEIPSSHPPAQNLMDTDSLPSQKLPTDLSRSQGAKKEPGFQIDLARKGESPNLDTRSRLQAASQSQELRISGATEGIGGERLHSQKAQMDCPSLTLRESLKQQIQKLVSCRQEDLPVSQDFRSSESPPLLWSFLWQKAKSFEQVKPCLLLGPQLGQATIQRMAKKDMPVLQLPQETKGALIVQREEGSLVEIEHQKFQKSNILYLQNLKQWEGTPQSQAEKVVLAEKCVQTDLLGFHHQGETTPEALLEIAAEQVNLGEKRPGETGELENRSSCEPPRGGLQKLPPEDITQRELELLEHSGSFRQEDILGEVQIQGNQWQKEVCVQQLQEYRSLDSPPLLWGFMGQKSKSFELRTSSAIEAPEVKVSPMAPLWRRADMEFESSILQKWEGLDVASSQDLNKEVESPPDKSKMGLFQSGGILPTDPQQSQSPKVNNSEILQFQEAGPRTSISPSLSEREVLMGQTIRQTELSQTWITSQEKPKPSEMPQQVVELIKDSEMELEDQQGSVTCKMKFLETLLHPEESRSFGPSPLLGRVLEIKSKSFELIKSQGFQGSSSEAALPSSQQDPQASHVEESSNLEVIPLSEKLQMKPESQRTQRHEVPQVYYPTDLGEQVVTQFQSVYTQTLDSISMQHLLENSKVVQILELQELKDLDIPQGQSDEILEEPEKLEHMRSHGENISALTSPLASERKTEYLQHAKCGSPETSPLLWWVWELAHHGILYNISPQPQELGSYSPGTQRQEGLQSESAAQHPRSQTVSSAKKLQKVVEAPQPQKESFQVEGSVTAGDHLQSQECIGLEPSHPLEIVPQVETTSPGLSVSEAFQYLAQEKAKSCQGPEGSPPDLEIYLLKDREPVSVEESLEGDVESREGFLVTQQTLTPMKPKDLGQEEISKLCESSKVIHSHDHQTLDMLGKVNSLDPSPSPTQLQRLKADTEQCGLLNGSQVLHPKEPVHDETWEEVKQEDLPILDPSEEQSKIEVDLPLEKPLGKSKSFDLGELQILKAQEPPKKGSFQTQTTEALKIQEHLPKKDKEKIDSQSPSQEKNLQLLQSHESASKNPSILQNSSTQTSELLEMDSCSLQSPELREIIQLQSSKPQSTTTSKMLCLQGHHEAENCEPGIEDSHPEMQGNLQRSPQTLLAQDISYPLPDTFRKSKSLEFPKANIVLLHALKKPDISRSQENMKEPPQIFDDQMSSQGINMSLQENKSRCPTQKELKDSQSQEELGQNKPATLNPQDDQAQQFQRQEIIEVVQSPGIPQEDVSLQSNPEYFGSRDLNPPDVLQPEKHSATPETLEFGEHVKPVTPLSLGSAEKGTLSIWWPLGKSKSLDFREYQMPCLKSLLGELDYSKPQKMPSANLSQPQRSLQDEQWKCKTPMIYSETQPIEDLISKDEIGQREENSCADQKTEHMEQEAQKFQELLKHEREITTSDKIEDIQMFCSKEYKEAPQLLANSQSLKEPLSIDQCMPIESESQRPRKPLDLDHQGERNLQSPPLLKNPLRKSKEFGYEEQTSRVDPQIQDVQGKEEPGEWHRLYVERQLLLQRFEVPTPQIIQEISNPEVLQHQEIANVESIGQSTGQPSCPREVHEIEMESIKSKISLHANQEPPQEQEDTVVPQHSIPHVVLPCDSPQLGLKFLQELGRLHNELSTLSPLQEVKDGKAICPQSAKGSSQPQQQMPAEPQINRGSQVLKHQKLSSATSPQPSPSTGDFSEASKMQLQSSQSQGPDWMPGIKKESVRSMRSPMKKAPQMVQHQEDLSKKPIMVPGMKDRPLLQSLENVEAKIMDLQEPISLEGKVREKEPMVTELQEDHPSIMQEALMAKSKSLEPQSLLRTQKFQHEKTKTIEGFLPSLDKEVATKSSRSISQGPLNIQAEAISSQSQEFVTKQKNQSILLAQKEKAQQVDQHYQEKYVRLKLQERRKLKSWKDQKLGSLQLQRMKENQAFQEWRKARTLGAEGTQPRDRSTHEKGLLNLAEREPEDDSRRLQRFWEQKTTETTAMTLLSPTSHGKPSETMWEPSSLNVDIFIETSFDADQPSSSSSEDNVRIRVTCPGDSPSLEKSTDQPWPSEPNPKAIGGFHGEGMEGQPPLPPRPPTREKANIWLSPQDKRDMLQRLAESQAEGERRRWRDKERQALRFQERLLIAKCRRSKEDLLRDNPADRWPRASSTSKGQDEAGQKMAVKTHLEKIKRERTYIMQSKRERNTLKFKELLDPLVARREEKPTLRRAEEHQQGNLCCSGSPKDRVNLEALSHICRRVPKEE
ncbi:uncharacterized protein [Erythrolamprus reginae]|uniref:uncharacterized protein n=1 Tax=Erythrolamprus reginae TaxID=121349 RepID=UPI00396CCD3F